MRRSMFHDIVRSRHQVRRDGACLQQKTTVSLTLRSDLDRAVTAALKGRAESVQNKVPGRLPRFPESKPVPSFALDSEPLLPILRSTSPQAVWFRGASSWRIIGSTDLRFLAIFDTTFHLQQNRINPASPGIVLQRLQIAFAGEL